MFKDLRVSVRLGIGFTAVVGLFTVTLLLVGVSLFKLTRDVKQINEQTLPYVLVVDEMDVSRSEVQQFLTDVSATHDRSAYQEAEKSAQHFLTGVGKFKQLYRQANDAKNLKQIEAIEASFNRFNASGKIMAEAYINKGIDAGNLLMKGTGEIPGFDRESETIADELAVFRKQQVAEANEITADTLSEANATMSKMVWGGLAAALLAAVLGMWIVRSILRQLGGEPAYAAEMMSRIANGDLTVEVRTSDNDNSSLLFAVKDMVNKLTGIVTDVRTNTDSITTASQQIAAGNLDLSQRTEEQAASLEETASSVAELLSTVRLNTESAKNANHLAQGTSDVAEQSGKTVGKLVATMTAINESSRKIEDIISTIDGIAFQTNILALNAAVEAARAGEQGRGFAVVASEVRNLAQRSAAAAREIKMLIGDSVEKVSVGSQQVTEAADGISDVVTSVQLVASLMKEIAAVTTEQSMSIEQVNTAISQMDSVTQQNAALVEQAAAAAEALTEQASNLYAAVGVFKLTDSMGAKRTALAKPASAPHRSSASVQERYQHRLASKT